MHAIACMNHTAKSTMVTCFAFVPYLESALECREQQQSGRQLCRLDLQDVDPTMHR